MFFRGETEWTGSRIIGAFYPKAVSSYSKRIPELVGHGMASHAAIQGGVHAKDKLEELYFQLNLA